jgi:uncharacterized protein YqhQ
MPAPGAHSSNGDGPQTARVRLGGMALRNGLLVHGPEHWAVAVRSDEGDVVIGSGAKLRFRSRLSQLPGIRGVARLIEAFAVVPMARRAVPQARLPFEDPRVMGTMTAASLLSALVRRSARAGVRREALVSLLGTAPAAVALTSSDLAAYHGAEHKVIAAHEQDTDPRTVPKEHPRCGSTLVVPMAITGVAGNVLARSVLRIGGPLVGPAVALAAAAVSVEMFVWSERHGDEPLARAFRWPGIEIQRVVATRDPSEPQLQVAEAAMREILSLER